MQDVKDAYRQLTHRRGTSLTIVLTLALGIGANALVFSAVRGVLLAPLPYPQPERLVNLWETQPGNTTRGVAPANFLDWRSAASFDGIAAYNRKRRSIGGDRPERMTIATVSANFFDVLGVSAVAGRTFTATAPAGAAARSDPSRRLLAATLRRRPQSLIGKTIRLDDETVFVAGVVPRALAFPEDAVAWTQAPHDIPELGPGAPGDLSTVRDAWYFRVVGRLKPGVTIAQAQAEMDAIASRLAASLSVQQPEAGVRVVGLQAAADRNVRADTVDPAGCRRLRAGDRLRQRRDADAGRAAADARARAVDPRGAGRLDGFGCCGSSSPRACCSRSRAAASVSRRPCSGSRRSSRCCRPARRASTRSALTGPSSLFTLGRQPRDRRGIRHRARADAVARQRFTPLRDGGRSGQSRRGTRMTACPGGRAARRRARPRDRHGI